MAKKFHNSVVNRPTKENSGRTDVVLELIAKDGTSEMIPLGYIVKSRNVAEYAAFTLEGVSAGTFGTRAQAHHGLNRARMAAAEASAE